MLVGQRSELDFGALTTAVRAAATHQQQQQQLLNTTTARVNNIEAKASAAPGCTIDETKQLNGRIDHVVNLIGDIGVFNGPDTISCTVAAIKTDITKLQTRPDAATKTYKMPHFHINKFDDYNKSDALTWWQRFLTEASCRTVLANDMMKAFYLHMIGGAQTWMNHLAATNKCTIAELHTHITWKEFEKLWFTRFMVRNVVKAAMNEVYTCSQGNMPTRDWTTKWQKIVTTPGFDLSFPNQRSEFFSRSCAGLRTALGNEYDYASLQAILDRANLVIQTDDKAANERQSQPHYVAKPMSSPVRRTGGLRTGCTDERTYARTAVWMLPVRACYGPVGGCWGGFKGLGCWDRCGSGREPAGNEEFEDNEEERRAVEGGDDDGESDAEDMEVRREVERAMGKLRKEKAVDEDSTPDEDAAADDDDEGADLGASLDGGLMGDGRRGQEGAARAMKEAAGSKKRKRKAKMTTTEARSAPSEPKKSRVLPQTFMLETSIQCGNENSWTPSCNGGIPQQQRVVADMVAAIRRDIEATGATILTDGRKSITSDQIVNFLAAGPTGAYLFRTVERDGAVKETTEAVVERWKDVFDKFGVDKVNAICTDSAFAYADASKLLAQEEEKYSRITWLPCVVHVCNLLLSDIAKDGRDGSLGKREDTIIRARAVVRFIGEHGAALSLYRRFSAAHPSSASAAAGGSSSAPPSSQRRGRELVYPVQTRFVTHYLMLERLLDRRRALEALMMSDDWLRTAWRRSIFLQARWVRHQVRYAPVWEHVEDIVALMTPVMLLLRRLDRGGHVMTRMWSWGFVMVDRVARASLNRTSKDELHIVVQACLVWVAHLLEPAHCMAHLLNPRQRSITFFGAARRTDHERILADESLRYLRQQTGGDEDLYQTLHTQLAEFHSRKGDWTYGGAEGDRDAAACKGEKETSQVGQWWVQHGDGVPLFQSIAIRLSHTWTCASPAERNWAVHERVQVKRRNHLGFIKLTRLVEISTNLRLSRCQGRGSGYVLPWEDVEGEREDAIPPPHDEGVRPVDQVTEAQRDRQNQRGRKDRLSKAPPNVATYFGRRATVLMAHELESVYDPEPDPMAQDAMEAKSWSDPDDLAVELEPGGSDDDDDDTPLFQIPRPRTRASTASDAPCPAARPISSASDVSQPGPADRVESNTPHPSTDRRGQGGTCELVDEGDDGDGDDREGYEGSSEDEDDPCYSPTRGHGDDDDDEGADGGRAVGGLRKSERQRGDRCSGAGRGGSGPDVGGAGRTGGAGRAGTGKVR
ncbi:hypothetical protein CBR_g58025 [Chara braunii]|uniref:DUF659 domain-containing protein n=1 Tax=Chara braunii TaxID=69332 RepID=A0A388MEJ3_CHABU|nr:hypothetical protein CBR_g58025 [Chara braunii]|eukprot:GBG92977.1 hypothetical protein CBR_g58025 [Chara braunii]